MTHLALNIIFSVGIFSASTLPILPMPYSGRVADPIVNIFKGPIQMKNIIKKRK
jgi:hypothetical protein